MFQPSPLASQQKLGKIAGKDPLDSAVLLATPRAMADRYMQLYSNANDMHAMLQLECAYALQFIVLLDKSFHGLGQQVLDSLCKHGILTSLGP